MAIVAADRPLLTIGETAERLRVSETTVRRLIDAGVLPAVRVSAGAIRIERDELASWIGERKTAGASSPFSHPRAPAAPARDPDPAGSRSRTEREGAKR